jgi:hypothetical protein
MGVISGTVLWNGQEHNGRTVAYFHPKDVGLYHFGVCITLTTLVSLLQVNQPDSFQLCTTLHHRATIR